MKDKLFFTADTHFWHKNIMKFTDRPWDTLEEMNEGIIQRWNETVPEDGVVYILGDVFFCGVQKAQAIAERLNGELHLVLGNHDKGMKASVKGCFTSIKKYYELYVDDEGERQQITLSHFPFLVWCDAQHGAWNLHGHSHGTLTDLGGKRLDVGMDVQDCRPISYSEVKEYMSTRPYVAFDHHNERTNR